MIPQSFEVIPAIDVLDGRVVRLAQGRRDAITIEAGSPVELARRYASEGATRLHLVDLDGAFSGVPSPALVEQLASATGLPVQVGGGYRTPEQIAAALAAGADRVMVGTAALSETFVSQAVERFGAGLTVAVDVRDGVVAVEGWTRSSHLAAPELAERCARAGVERILVTAASRDGSLAGPDLALLAQLVPAGLAVVAAGGIASIEDVLAVRDLGCEAVVAGSALLLGRFTLAQARTAIARPRPVPTGKPRAPRSRMSVDPG